MKKMKFWVIIFLNIFYVMACALEGQAQSSSFRAPTIRQPSIAPRVTGTRPGDQGIGPSRNLTTQPNLRDLQRQSRSSNQDRSRSLGRSSRSLQPRARAQRASRQVARGSSRLNRQSNQNQRFQRSRQSQQNSSNGNLRSSQMSERSLRSSQQSPSFFNRLRNFFDSFRRTDPSSRQISGGPKDSP